MLGECSATDLWPQPSTSYFQVSSFICFTPSQPSYDLPSISWLSLADTEGNNGSTGFNVRWVRVQIPLVLPWGSLLNSEKIFPDHPSPGCWGLEGERPAKPQSTSMNVTFLSAHTSLTLCSSPSVLCLLVSLFLSLLLLTFLCSVSIFLLHSILTAVWIGSVLAWALPCTAHLKLSDL